jgi:uncharacterized RDD family membrane protein YckC
MVDVRPHEYDPVAQPELFEGVMERRVIAFLIDLVVLGVPLFFFAAFILMLGFATFGLGLFLFVLYWPVVVVWGLLYYGLTLGSAQSATIGMRMMDIELRTSYGAPSYFVLGATHGLGYWLSTTFLTPLILLVALFNERRRLLHDIVLGTVVINSPARAAMLRGRPL